MARLREIDYEASRPFRHLLEQLDCGFPDLDPGI
jgi:hypothetical protein